MNRKRINKGFANSFNSQENTTDIPYALLKAARQSGQLNLSNRSLGVVPEKVWKINIDIPEETKNVTLGDSDERWWDQTELRKLILASNKLTEIDSNVKHLPALTVLDAHDNSIVKIAEEIEELKELSRLHLSHNKLSSFPKSFCSLASLVSVHLSSNEIVRLPEDFGYLCKIEDLELSNNQLKELPESIGNIRALKKLNLSKNEITSLPAGFENLTSLKDLNLSSNKLTTLPTGFGKLTSLEIVDCRYNTISKFEKFNEPANIKQMFLGYNHIKEIDQDVFDTLPFLVTLDLRDNFISSIPESLPKLKCLERIDLSNNSLPGLPYVIGNMNLNSLTLDGNPLRGIRRDIVSRGTHAILAYLKSRIPEPSAEEIVEEKKPLNKVATNPVESSENKENIDSRDAPKSTVKEPSQNILDTYAIATTKILTHSNGAAKLPNDFWLPGAKITKIDVKNNTLTEFPNEIIQYAPTLSEINLSKNKITVFPDSIGDLTKLNFIDFSNNLLTSLPDKLEGLVHLMEIVLSFNQFTVMPKVLFRMPKLQTILLANNKLSEIDVDGLLQLKTLHTLDLSNNNIARIEPQLGNVSWLKSLTLDGNAFRNPRAQIMTKGTQYILEYLRDRIPT